VATDNSATDTEHSWDQVREFAYSFAHKGRTEVISLDAADKRICAENLVALTNLPFANSSSMDGWAVNGNGPWKIADAPQLEKGQASVTTTGAALPIGAQAILRTENGVLTGDHLKADTDNSANTEDIRIAGEECVMGQALCAPGVTLNPALIGLLAATGHDEIQVFAQPCVQIIITGDELLTSGLPTREHVRDSLGIQIPMWLKRMGAHVLPVFHIGDQVEEISAALIVSPADIVLTTGGTAASAKDHFVSAISIAGGEVHFDGVAVRPGHPMKFAAVPNPAEQRIPVVGLPGNPLAAIVALATLVQPMLNKLLGQQLQPLIPVTTSRSLTAGKSGAKLVPGRVTAAGFMPAEFGGSAMLRGLSGSTGFAVIDSAVNEGDTISFLPLPG
jgi:molybdopterin molybdotransferase